MDNLFPNLGAGRGLVPTFDDPQEEYEYKIHAMIEDAIAYQEDYRTPNREISEKYYQALEPALDEEGRSTIVATEVRDTVMAIMPSLIRIFTSNEHIVSFTPGSEDKVPMAKQAMDYLNYVFWNDNDGFMIIHSVLKDALKKAEGIVEWYSDISHEVVEKEFTHLLREEFQYVISQPSAEVVDFKEYLGHSGPLYDVLVRFEKSKPLTKVEEVPPWEFLIDRNAKSCAKSTLCGRLRMVPISDLIAKGIPPELIEEYGSSSFSYQWTEEQSLINPGNDITSGRTHTTDMVLYGTFYVRIDGDGDGIAERRHICTIGDDFNIVSDTPCDTVKMALFGPDPEPHTAIGGSITDLVMDLQKIKTNVLRSTLDSLSDSIWGRQAVDQNRVNMDDVLNNEIGAPVRVRGDVTTAIKSLGGTFVGEPALGVLNYLDLIRQARTGISEASKGIDPKALQSTSVKGVDAIITGAQERIELIARILAETGFKEMFKGLLREVTEHPNQERNVELRGEWVTVRPDQYDPDMDVKVNPTLGRGSDTDRFNILMSVLTTQKEIIGAYGPDNPLCGPMEVRNTLEDILSINNIKDVSRFFKKITPETLAAIQLAQANKLPDPATIVANAQVEKIRADTAKAMANTEIQRDRLDKDDRFRIIKLVADSTLKEAEIEAKAAKDVDPTQSDVKRDIPNAG